MDKALYIYFHFCIILSLFVLFFGMPSLHLFHLYRFFLFLFIW